MAISFKKDRDRGHATFIHGTVKGEVVPDGSKMIIASESFHGGVQLDLDAVRRILRRMNAHARRGKTKRT